MLEPSTLEVALGNLALLARDCVCLSGVKFYSFTQLPGGLLAAPHPAGWKDGVHTHTIIRPSIGRVKRRLRHIFEERQVVPAVVLEVFVVAFPVSLVHLIA